MSAAVAAAAAAACCSSRNSSSSSSSTHHTAQNHHHEYSLADHHRRRRCPAVVVSTMGSRYESQKRREWMSFIEYMREKRPGLVVSACSGDDVVEFLEYYLDGDDQKVQVYWGSVEAIIGRLRVAFEEIMGGQALAHTTTNPFNAPAVRLYLRRLKEAHSHHHHHQQQRQLNSNLNNVFLYRNYL